MLLLYREVRPNGLPWLNTIERQTHTKRMPFVLTSYEIASLRAQMVGMTALLAKRLVKLLYTTGMRLMAGMRLGIKDVKNNDLDAKSRARS